MTEEERMALDEEVCKYLGIEPKRKRDCRCKRSPYLNDDQNDASCRCSIILIYPAVSTTWEGLGLVVERLRAKERRWDHMALPTSWGAAIFDSEAQRWSSTAYGESLPLALALAVQQLAKERG